MRTRFPPLQLADEFPQQLSIRFSSVMGAANWWTEFPWWSSVSLALLYSTVRAGPSINQLVQSRLSK